MKQKIRTKDCRSSKPGLRPRESFFVRLKRRHPRISVAYSSQVRQWVTLQRGLSGNLQVVFFCGPRLSEVGVLRKLDECRIGRMSVREIQFLEEDIDQYHEDFQRAVDSKASEGYQEGADRLYSILGSETRVSMHGSRSK